MGMNAFDILMVIALGSLTGTGSGLIIGFIVKKRRTITSLTNPHGIVPDLALVVVSSCLSIAGFAWLSLV
jgi:hypothetical protein